MKIYVDYLTKKVNTIRENPFYKSENLVSKIEVYVANVTDDYFVSLDFLLPTGQKCSISTRDSFEVGENTTLFYDGLNYDIHNFTLNDYVLSHDGQISFTAFINFTEEVTEIISGQSVTRVYVKKRGALANGFNNVIKTQGYNSNTMLVLDETDGATVVQNMQDEITRLNGLLISKFDKAKMADGSIDAMLKSLRTRNGITTNSYKYYIVEDGSILTNTFMNVHTNSDGEILVEFSSNLDAVRFYSTDLQWNGVTIATQYWVNQNYYNRSDSNGRFAKLDEVNTFSAFNTFNGGTQFNGSAEFTDDIYCRYIEGDDFWLQTGEFSVAPTIRQLQQSDNSAVTRKYVNDSITEAMKEHIIDYWFEVSNGQLVLKQKLQNQTIMTRQVTLPSVLQNATFDETTMKLTLDFVNGQDIEVDLSELNDVYGVENNGHNVVLSLNNGKFSADLTQVVLDKLEQAFDNEETRISNETTREAYFNSIKNTLNSVSGTLCVVDVDANGNMNLTTVDFE